MKLCRTAAQRRGRRPGKDRGAFGGRPERRRRRAGDQCPRTKACRYTSRSLSRTAASVRGGRCLPWRLLHERAQGASSDGRAIPKRPTTCSSIRAPMWCGAASRPPSRMRRIEAHFLVGRPEQAVVLAFGPAYGDTYFYVDMTAHHAMPMGPDMTAYRRLPGEMDRIQGRRWTPYPCLSDLADGARCQKSAAGRAAAWRAVRPRRTRFRLDFAGPCLARLCRAAA